MSAYGSISRPVRTSYLPSTAWPNPRDPSASSGCLTIHHIDQSAIKLHPGLFDYLHAVFSDEVGKGLTYPQEDMRDPNAFGAYFFGADVLIAITPCSSESSSVTVTTTGSTVTTTSGASGEGAAIHTTETLKNGTRDSTGAKETAIDLQIAAAGRSWDECVAGFYYVKPNYPGRSSHICNAGFVVPPSQRSHGYGRVLAKSYLYYAPKLGYKASVFNLVYVNNLASVRLWEKLNFTKAGLIPKAGRLRRTDGPGEEYVDAWVFYKSFEDETGDVSGSSS